MSRDGRLSGIRKNFPVKIFDGMNRTYLNVKDSDELVELIDKKYSELKEIKKNPDLYEDVLWNFGIGEDEKINTVQLCDNRTLFLIKNYLFYRNNPSQAFNNKAWFDSVIQLNSIYNVQI